VICFSNLLHVFFSFLQYFPCLILKDAIWIVLTDEGPRWSNKGI
jgi:hypothetical protein